MLQQERYRLFGTGGNGPEMARSQSAKTGGTTARLGTQACEACLFAELVTLAEPETILRGMDRVRRTGCESRRRRKVGRRGRRDVQKRQVRSDRAERGHARVLRELHL